MPYVTFMIWKRVFTDVQISLRVHDTDKYFCKVICIFSKLTPTCESINESYTKNMNLIQNITGTKKNAVKMLTKWFFNFINQKDEKILTLLQFVFQSFPDKLVWLEHFDLIYNVLKKRQFVGHVIDKNQFIYLQLCIQNIIIGKIPTSVGINFQKMQGIFEIRVYPHHYALKST